MYFSLISKFGHNIVTIIEYNINNNKSKHHNSDISRKSGTSLLSVGENRQERKKAPEKITEL